MKEKDLHKIIRNNGGRDNTLLVNALKAQHPELKTEQSPMRNRHSRKFKSLVAIFATMSAAAVAAIVLIPTLLLTNNKHGKEQDHYIGSPAIPAYTTTILDCTIQEYNEKNGTDILYFNCENAIDFMIIQYNKKTTNTFLGLSVRYTDANTDDKIEYIACSDDSDIYFLKYNKILCTNEQVIGGYSVKWTAGNNSAYGIFSYGHYDYHIMLKNNNQTRLFELIQELLPSQE